MSRNSTEFVGIPDQLYHWIPGEMVVIVRLPRLPADDIQDALVEQIRTLLNGFLARYLLALEPYGTYGRWRVIPTMPPVRRHSFIFGFHRKQPLIAMFFHTRHADSSVQDPSPMALSYLQGHLEQLAQAGLHVVSAMPNWTVMAAPMLYSNGGPAIPPRPAPALDVPSPGNDLVGWRTSVMDQRIPLDSKGAEDVLVAVLDTALHPDRIRSAASRLELRRNWLLQRLANELQKDNDSLSVEYDRYALTNDVRT